MPKCGFVLACLFAVGMHAQDIPARAWMPMPASIQPGQGSLSIDASFSVAIAGYREPRLDRAALRLISRLEQQTGILLNHDIGAPGRSATLVLSCDHPGKAVQEVNEDESYRLEVTPAGAHLNAAQPLGVLRGIETFLQAVEPGARGFQVRAAIVNDRPRFPWRGLSFDVSRHFFSVDEIKRTLDGMAVVKLNVFHWHLSDNQGFRVESTRYPLLQRKGSDGLFYTQAEVRDIIAYARDRGIRVIPEFDMPGHSTAMLVAYPYLATPPAPAGIDRSFGVKDPVMDPAKESTYVFLDGFLGEMAALFPDRYFHIGGDEVNGKVWRESAEVDSFKKSHHLTPTSQDPYANHAFQAYFNKRVQAILNKHNKRMDGWDEILAPDLPNTILIQSWRGQASLAEAASRGYEGILSFGYYVDLCWPAWRHYEVDPLDREAGALKPDEQKRILGGEAAMWSEWVTPETINSRVWPRTAVVAERLWSPREVKDVGDMYRRLELVSARLDRLGLGYWAPDSRMLRRLAGSHDPEPLQILSTIVEPVKDYEREQFGPFTTSTPFIGLVDAVPPESHEALRFSHAVTRCIEQHTGCDLVRASLAKWSRNDASLAALTNENLWLAGVATLSSRTAELARIGLEACDSLPPGKPRNAAWKDRSLTAIKDASRPSAALTPAISESIARLVSAASRP